MNKAEKSADHGGEMGFFEHLGELRNRLLIIAAALLVSTIICYWFSEELFKILKIPLEHSFKGHKPIGTGPAEAFLLKLKTAFFAGLLLSLPVVFFQIWLFISPGLYPGERKLFLPFMVCSVGLFAFGVWFCFSLVMPIAYEFFQSQYESIGVEPTIRIGEHFSLIMKVCLGFGIVFEMPILAYFLGRLGIIDDKFLISGFRHAIVVIFIIAAVLTPPDVLTQFMMAGPLIVLYGLSILIVRFTRRNTAADDSSQPSSEAAQD